MIIYLLFLGSGKFLLPVGLVALIVQLVYPNSYTPIWADILLIAISLLFFLFDESDNRKTNFRKHNKRVDRNRLDRKQNKHRNRS